ncbi:hypothetical protein ACJW31_07G061200 [Castanea mollissima]
MVPPCGASTASGSGSSPSKYLTTCLIVGRALGSLLEHIKPSLSNTTASSSSNSPSNLESTTSNIPPSLHFSHTQSTNMSSSGNALCSIGLLPHTTSSNTAPNAKTSVLFVGLPVLLGLVPRSYSLARPKSLSRAFSSESNKTFPALMSL